MGNTKVNWKVDSSEGIDIIRDLDRRIVNNAATDATTLNAKVYRNKPMVKSYGTGDTQVVVKKPNPKPNIMKLIEEEMVRKNPRKYSNIT